MAQRSARGPGDGSAEPSNHVSQHDDREAPSTSASQHRKPPSPDPDAAVQFLGVFRPTPPWVLTAIVPDGKTTTWTKTTAQSVKDFIVERNVTERENIYYSVAVLLKQMSKKATKADVKHSDYLHVDADPADDETPEAFKTRLLPKIEALERKPSILIDSGNGLQLLWRLEKPVADQAEVEAANCALAESLGANPSTRNVDRILRLSGTVNYPDKVKRDRGRVPCVAKLLYSDSATYRFEDFPKSDAAKRSGSGKAASFDPSGVTGIEPDDPRLEKMPKKWVKVAYEGVGISTDRSDSVWAFTCDCIRAGVADDAIASCLIHWKIGEHVRDQYDVKRALNRTIQNAHGEVENSTLFKMNKKHCVLPIGGWTGDDHDVLTDRRLQGAARQVPARVSGPRRQGEHPDEGRRSWYLVDKATRTPPV